MMHDLCTATDPLGTTNSAHPTKTIAPHCDSAERTPETAR